ncbi:MAG: efflux RND transporter periplasmic adaptor subunit [Runella slithyformis]|nr:MAG: efflux RND transporter periplasmic adaptor subunit [Runella slithyformis]TAF02054.1 MAG: efflux RND transporter periplasmic adaptor subunit [Runella slithyformis]TAF27598.1 MAG: efflux RND transporter periplasmic adaptor subunit [Runella slithyformis]TAF49877.1 MAG: efflux RND transporter periplasmic adaptor subunit [Runella slithyformis]TAH14862.1 MAG: efflux RND transporter periplasmic adaptor subunit [Runella slithyformis]
MFNHFKYTINKAPIGAGRRCGLGAILITLLLAACGGEKQLNTLADKKTALSELKNQQKELAKKIEMLDAEVKKLDPSLQAVEKIMPVVTETASLRNFRSFIELQGTVETKNTATATPRMAGTYTAVYVREGQSVKAGQLLAKIDNDILKDQIAALKQQMELANTVFEKQKGLWDQKIGTEIQYLQAKNNKESLEKNLALLNTQGGMYNVYAPIGGAIERVMAKTGEIAVPGMPLASIVNLGSLKASANVPDTYLSNIKMGDAVKVKLPDLGREMNARITFISKLVNPASRTFKIEVAIPSSADIKPNMVSILNISDINKSNALVIKQNYIQGTEDGDIVYVATTEGNKKVAKARKIKTGVSYNGEIEITAGLQAGDLIIIEGYQDLVDGQVIRPQTPDGDLTKK